MEDKKVPTRINAELIYFQLDSINKRLDKFEQVFVTKAESQALKHQIEELRQDFQDSRTELSEEIKNLKRSKNLWNWLGPTLTAVVTAVFTYLTIEYLKRS